MNDEIKKFKELRIEINSECNRNCSFCPRGNDNTRWYEDENGNKRKVKKYMDIETVKSLLRQNISQGFKANVGFDFYNEPTLDERLFDILDYARSIGTPRLEIVTNGDKIKKDKKYAQALFSKIDFAVISLYDYKDNNGRDKLIAWWDNYLKNEVKIPWSKFKATGANVKYENGYYVYSGYSNRAGQIPRVRGKRKFMAHANRDKDLPLTASCKKIHSKMNIRFDGEVSICCEDSLIEYSLGNINEKTIQEVWYGDKMKQATKLLNRGLRKDIKPCSKCVKGVCPVVVSN
jgi:radical SAM protein with 4Fe4S-binding SPASM domain